MPLSFDQKWLGRSNDTASPDICIQAYDGKRSVQFRIARALAVSRLTLPVDQRAEPAIDRWGDALKTACANAFVRPHAVGAPIRVKAEDFRPVLKFY